MATTHPIQSPVAAGWAGPAGTAGPRPDDQAPVRTAAPLPSPPDPVPVSREQMAAALAEVNEALAKVRPEPFRVSFSEEEGSGRMVITIKSAEGEVLKQYPPEKILNLLGKMDDLVGMIVDEAT